MFEDSCFYPGAKDISAKDKSAKKTLCFLIWKRMERKRFLLGKLTVNCLFVLSREGLFIKLFGSPATIQTFFQSSSINLSRSEGDSVGVAVCL